MIRLYGLECLQSWLRKKHMTRQREKPKHCQDHIGIISPLNNSEHNTILHTCPTVHGVDTVFGRVRAKHKERQSMRNTDRQPVVQIYGCFVAAGENVQRRTILAGTFVQTGGVCRSTCPRQLCVSPYGIDELQKVAYKTGRAFSILQYEKELKSYH